MWKRISALVFLVAVVGVLAVKSVSAKSPDETAIRKLWEDYSAAVHAKDLGKVMSFYAADVIAYDAFPPRQYVGSAAYRKAYELFFAEFPGPVTSEISDVHVAASGNLAYAAGMDRWTVTDKVGKKTTMVFRVTNVFRKTNGRWLIVHEHLSFPTDPQSGMADMMSK